MPVIKSNYQIPYKLKSLTNCKPPFKAEGSNWYQYEISQGSNIITGYKCGDHKHVLESVQLNIDQLNQRQKGKYGNMNISKPKS